MAQQSGNVTALLEARSTVTVEGNPIECLIDTGFTGALVLPRSFIERLQVIHVGRESFTTVGNHRVEADIVLAQIEWIGQKRIHRVIVSQNDDALVGSELLEGTILTIDYIAATVLINRPD